MTGAQHKQLENCGYLSLPGVLSSDLLKSLQTRVEQLFEEEGDNAGSEFRQEANTRRLANLVAKDALFREMILHPEVLSGVESVLGPSYKLSSLNARSANPHSDSHQPLHVDMGLLPDERGYAVCNTVWMLDDFTETNGAIRAVPGSHRLQKLPPAQLANVTDVHQEVLITGTAGTVIVMNAHVWHGGTANRTGYPRRALHGFFCRSDIPQQQYQKQLIPAELQATFSTGLRRLLALDDQLNDQMSRHADRPSGFLR